MRYAFITVITLLTTGLLSGSVHAQETLDSICAIVDRDIILESEVGYGISSMLLEQNIRRPTPEQILMARRQILQAYITQKILLARAEEDSLNVEDRTVEKELAKKFQQVVNQVGGEAKLEEYFGRPIRLIKREMRKGVRESLLIDMVRRRHLVSSQVRRQDVTEFYDEHKSELPTIPQKVTLSHILFEVTPSEEAKEAAREKINSALLLLEAGADFDSVAATHSDDPSKDNGGRLGMTNRGDLVPEFEEVAYALEPGEISGVVLSPFGYHIIKLIERQGERISTQHILARLTPGEDDWTSVRTFAATVRDSILAGADFGAMAEKYSSDKDSKSKRGKLDEMPVENLPVEFVSAITGLTEGSVTTPVTTTFGIHLIRVDAENPSHAIHPDTDWELLEQYALNNKREQEFISWVVAQYKDHYIWPEFLTEIPED
jgi:peptidyl-prolyl cis-trans isomerase SurA